MRKLILLLFSICFVSVMYSQEQVYGIKFGTTKEDAKSYLENRVGKYDVVDDGSTLTVYKQDFAGINFNILEFEFEWKGGTAYFNSAAFQKYFAANDVTDAKECRDFVFEKIKKKYTYYEQEKNSDGFLRYKFGLNPNDSSKVTGMIDLIRSKGNDGIERLYLYVVYFPYIQDLGLDDL